MYQLILVTLCSRTLQTAVGVFGGEGYTDRMDIVPLYVARTLHFPGSTRVGHGYDAPIRTWV